MTPSLLAAFSLAAAAVLSHSSALGDLAKSMQPGTWRQLTTGNNAALLSTGSSGMIFHYAMTSAWDPVDERLYFIGEDHGQFASMRWVYYDAATNAWVVKGQGQPTMPNLPGHAYDHLTIDNEHRVLYAGVYGSATIWKYPIATGGPWTSESMGNIYINITTGLQYFPGLGLTDYICGSIPGQVMVRELSGWTYVTAGGNGGYHGFSEYSPVHKVALFGGASISNKLLWRLNADKTITQLTDAPMGLGIQQYNVVADPVTGNFLVMGGEPRQLWEVDPRGTGTWTQLTGTHVPPSAVGNPVAGNAALFSGAISNYGVNIYITGNSRAVQSVYVYKHAATPPTSVQSVRKPAVIGIVVSPNPVTAGRAVVRRVGAGHAQPQSAGIYDLRGRCLEHFTFDGDFVWNTRQLSNGVYLLKIGEGARESVQRVLVQK